MKTGVVASALLMGILVLSSAADSQQDAARPQPKDIGASAGHLPKAHYIPSRVEMAYPVWVDASLVFNQDGGINTALIHPEGVKEIQSLRTRPSVNGCKPDGPFLKDIINLPPRTSPEAAAKNAQLVILGTVSEKSYGLLVTEPGQLLRVVPEDTLKGKPRDVDAYFVFFPVGTFMLDGFKVCKTDSRYPDVPAVGDQVILFMPPQTESQTEPYLEIDDGNGIITIHAGGTVSFPERYRDKTSVSAVDKDTLIDRVRAASADGGH
jgi:hypothetical protein